MDRAIDDLPAQLKRAAANADAAIDLMIDVFVELKAAVARLEAPAPAPAAAGNGIDPDQPARQIADNLWERIGRRRALLARTYLSQRAIREDLARRASNGNGAHAG
jgi:hypothetical protein